MADTQNIAASASGLIPAPVIPCAPSPPAAARRHVRRFAPVARVSPPRHALTPRRRARANAAGARRRGRAARLALLLQSVQQVVALPLQTLALRGQLCQLRGRARALRLPRGARGSQLLEARAQLLGRRLGVRLDQLGGLQALRDLRPAAARA